MRRLILIVPLATMLMAGGAGAQDWPEWRGPNRDGVASESPALIDGFDEKGPVKLWSAEVPGGPDGGYGQVTVAQGKAFVLSQRRYDAPIEPRVLEMNRIRQWGWAEDMPDELLKAVETARQSAERKDLKDNKAVNAWAEEWVKANVKDAWRGFRGAAKARLAEGPAALPMETLAKLATIADREFPNQADFDAWLAENGIDNTAKEKIMKAVPTTRRASEDYIWCLDARKGNVLWKIEKPGNWMWYPCSSTPTVRDGKVHVLGSTAVVYCLDVADGRTVWASEPLGGAHGHNRSSSVLLVDGKAIVSSENALCALDAATGKIVWQAKDVVNKEASAITWELNDRKRLLVAGQKKVHCVEVADGKTLWTVAGGEVGSTPVVAGSVMVFAGGAKDAGLLAYRVSDAEPGTLWNVPFMDRYASPVVYRGCVYAIGGGNETYGEKDKGKVMCVDLQTGEVAWEEVLGRGPELTSPLIADGKLIAVAAPWLYMIDADPQAYRLLGKANLGLARWTSPALADGKLYVRTNKEVICYEMAKK